MAEKKRAIPEMSIDTRLIAERLSKAEIGEVVTYVELSELIGRNIQNGARPRLASAREVVRRDYGMVFECVAKVGVKRQNDAEIVGSRESDIRCIHRRAKKGLDKLKCVDIGQLDRDGLTKFNAHASHLGVLNHITQSRAVKKLEGAVSQSQQQLPLAKTLEAFK